MVSAGRVLWMWASPDNRPVPRFLPTYILSPLFKFLVILVLKLYNLNGKVSLNSCLGKKRDRLCFRWVWNFHSSWTQMCICVFLCVWGGGYVHFLGGYWIWRITRNEVHWYTWCLEEWLFFKGLGQWEEVGIKTSLDGARKLAVFLS